MPAIGLNVAAGHQQSGAVDKHLHGGAVVAIGAQINGSRRSRRWAKHCRCTRTDEIAAAGNAVVSSDTTSNCKCSGIGQVSDVGPGVVALGIPLISAIDGRAGEAEGGGGGVAL